MQFNRNSGTSGDKPDTPVLLPAHRADLDASGLTEATVAAAGLYSEADGDRVRALLGSHLAVKTARGLGPCLAFPYHDAAGRPMTFTDAAGTVRPFIRLKPSKPRSDRSQKGRTIKYESPAGAPARAYLPPGSRAALSDPAVPLVLTEGEKKALAADQHGLACVGLGGVWSWQVKRARDEDGRGVGPRELIPDLSTVAWVGRRVALVFDSDAATNPNVQWAEYHLGLALKTCGAHVRVVRLPAGDAGRKVGLDDYLLGHHPDELRTLIAAAEPPTRPATGDDRPKIVIGTDEYRVNAEAVGALAPMPDLYQRAGMLVRVTQAEANPHALVRRPCGAPVVQPLPQPILRERMTWCARWVAIRRSKEGDQEVPAHPPDWSVSAVHARGHWPLVRPLEAVVSHPVVLSDGSVLANAGYDRTSRLLVSFPADLRLAVPDVPTRGDARAAVRVLDDVLGDFPFAEPGHRGAWFAGLLTPLAWFGFDGPAPLTLIDGNVRGIGKGLLADVIALVLTGRRFPVMSYTADKEELRKKITALAMEGERLVLLDNLAGAVGNDVLDMALTADRWKDRVLGGNKVYDGPLHVAWFATGNNVQLHADTARRCAHCRLETDAECPELRTDVKYPDLRRHVRENRGPLLSAALTILRAWYAADKPRHGLAPWGSFEGWSGVVREAVVYAGLADPGETRLALQSSADRDALIMAALLGAMERADPTRRGLTTAELIEAVRKPADPAPEWYADLRSAVEELCGKLDGRALGYRFRHFARRNFGGKMLDKVTGVSATNSMRWAVFPAAVATRSQTSPGSPASPEPGDTGDPGDVPAPPPMSLVPDGPPRPRKRFGNNDQPHERR